MSQVTVPTVSSPTFSAINAATPPRFEYLAKVWHRQFYFAAFVFIALLPFAAVLAWTSAAEYSSTVVAFYDDRVGIDSVPRDAMFPRFGQVSESFKTRLSDSDFLWQIAQQVGLPARVAAPSPWYTWLAVNVPQLSHFLPQLSQPANVDDLHHRELVTRVIRQSIGSNIDDRKNTLSVTAKAKDPVQARQLADAAMELFIQSQLRFEAESYRRQHELFASYLHDVARTEDAERRMLGDKKISENAAARTEQDILKDQEADIIDKIQLVKSEIEQEKSRVASSRSAIESELARLITRLQPSHPDVVAKQEELRSLSGSLDDRALRSRLNGFRQQLTEIRSAQRKLGMKVEIGEGREDALGLRGGVFIPNLSDRVNQLNLQEMDASRQAESPALRTRLRTVMPASYDLTSESRKLRQLLLTFLVIALVVAGTAAAIREMISPLARDPWRVATATGVPVVGNIDLSKFQSYPSISPQLAGLMRQAKRRSRGTVNGADATLLAYRQLAGDVNRNCRGKIVLFMNAAESSMSAPFCLNFMNVIAGETAGSLVVFDCNQERSLASETQEDAPVGKFADFLSGKASWKDIRLARSPNRAFDLVLADDRVAGPLSSDQLNRFFSALSKSYTTIFVRGNEADQILANANLMSEVTDCFVCVDATKTTYEDLRRILRVSDPERLRGIIMIGT